MKTTHAASNQRLIARMSADGRLNAQSTANLNAYLALNGGRVEEAILATDMMSEQDLLRYVATASNTRFVSTEKLFKAAIDPKILNLVPRKLAEQYSVVPVMYDDARRAVSVVTSDPDDLAMLNDVKMAAGVREVVALVARPAAIKAALERAYHGDANAFAVLMKPPEPKPQPATLDRFQTGQATPTGSGFGSMNLELNTGGPQMVPTPVAAVPIIHGNAPPAQVAGGFAVQGFGGTQHAVGAPAYAPAPQPMVAQMYAPQPVAQAYAPQPSPSQPYGEQHAQAYVPQGGYPPAPQPPPPPPTSDGGQKPGANGPARGRANANAEAAAPMVTVAPDYVETLNVFVSLLETARPDLRGHSGQCARLMRRVCERMGLSATQTAAYVVAAHIHDIGKAGTYHLTSLNSAEYDGHKAAAQKVYNVCERFLQAVNLHPDTKSAVNGMYERFDGKGFPLGTSGKDTPLGARILAVVDSYSDLTANPRNPARRILKAAEAMTFLARYRGSVFDPTILDLVKAEVAGDDLRAKLLSDRHTVLLVDPDPEDSTVLELRMLEAGFDVRTARTYQQAIHELKTREVTVVVSDVDLDSEDAGITLRTAAVGEPWGQKVTAWVIHTRKTDGQLAEIVFDLGVDDLVSKPTPPEVFVAKLRQLVERKQAARSTTTKGVSGSLAEMGLPDVIQILFHGRKTCTVRLLTKAGGGDIAFQDGQIVDARYGGKRGEDAFYQLLAVKDGDFKIDTEQQSMERTIDVSVEGLLLEGMRRLDEGLLG